MSHRSILVKILPKARVIDFLNGNIYLNTNRYFGTIDQSDVVRFDPYDGIDESTQIASAEVQNENGNWLLLPTVGPMSVRNHQSKFSNILCLYTITDRVNDEFDERNLGFGDYAIVINDSAKFIERILLGAKNASKQLDHGPVDYVDRDLHDGGMGVFRKFSNLSYQNEYRFVFGNGNGEACRLPIGNLRDITMIITSADIAAFRRRMLTI